MINCQKTEALEKLIGEEKITLKEREKLLNESQILIQALEHELEEEMGK